MSASTNESHYALGQELLDRASEFSLPALLDVIEQCFPNRRVRFCSEAHHKTRSFLIVRAWIEPDVVNVELSVGLKSASSPLPAYLRALLDDPAVDPSFLRLIEWIDDSLLRAEAYAFRPERAWRSSVELASLRSTLLRATPLGSLATVSWVLSAAFPELSVRVRRARLKSVVRVNQARLDYAVLDRAALGEYGMGFVPAIEATLSGTASSWPPRDWAAEATRRWPIVQAALAGSRVRLRATLDALEPIAPAVLDGVVGLDSIAISETIAAPRVIFDGSFDSLL
ncbi:MAG: hypothetical protein Q8Q09_25905 [Deltaproteobacteria bacterium]|nr:hypothetical protein [Deltaproteobacteria bacterium]